MTRPHAIVVGAGLAGSLMTLFLARRGARVTVLERRADLRRHQMSAGRSINLALSTRGLAALGAVGMADAVLRDAIPMRGRMMHDVDGTLTFQRYGREGQAIQSVSRRTLNEVLLDAAEQMDGVELRFDARCVDVDLEGGVVTTRDGQGERRQDHGELIVGADGAFSAVRARMARTDRFDFAQTYLEHGYKELTIPPAEDGGFRLEPNALHIWPRHDYMMIALPNADRTFTCTLFLPFAGGDASFEALQTPDDVLALFERAFPDAIALLPDLEREFFENPTGSLCYTSCKPYHRGRAVLLGDAAHAVVPFYGQGMNAAFEDCLLLDGLLGEHGLDDALSAIDAFSTSRKADGDAIRDLALHNFHVMRSSVTDPAFLERKDLEVTLSRLFPEWARSLYGLVTFSTTPYSEARRLAAEQDRLLDDVEARAALLTLGWLRELGGGVPHDTEA